MARVTKSDIHDAESAINHALERWHSDRRIFVQWAHGQPRAYWKPANADTVTDASDRMPTGEMLKWLTAFYKGLATGLDVAYRELKGE